MEVSSIYVVILEYVINDLQSDVVGGLHSKIPSTTAVLFLETFNCTDKVHDG